MKRVLIDVDTQFDFVAPEGRLHAPAPAGVLERIGELLRSGEYAAVLGSVDSHAYDAWEFAANGGPFPAHCVKGTTGWLRMLPELPARQRFVPMQALDASAGVQNLVGEAVAGSGNRALHAGALAREALAGVGLYFEKEVYSLFSNPAADPVISALVEMLGGRERMCFDVVGYCTGMDAAGHHYCVGSAAAGLAERGYRVRVLARACGPLGDRIEECRRDLERAGVTWEEVAA